MRLIVAGILLAGSLIPASSLNAQNIGPSVAFEMPLDIENWQPDIVGQNGIYRFRQAQGDCQITFVQNLGVDEAEAAGGTPRDTIENYVQQLASEVGNVERSEVPDLELLTSTGDPVTFLSEEVSYRGSDGMDYRNRISTQWIDAVELLIIAACPSSQWEERQAELESFFGKVSVHR